MRHILRTHTQTHTHTHSAKLVVRMVLNKKNKQQACKISYMVKRWFGKCRPMSQIHST